MLRKVRRRRKLVAAMLVLVLGCSCLRTPLSVHATVQRDGSEAVSAADVLRQSFASEQVADEQPAQAAQSIGEERLARLLKDINTAGSGSSPSSLTVVGSTLFFTADEPATGRELWALDLADTPTCAADITAHLSITRGRLRFNRRTGLYRQRVSLTNSGPNALPAPVALVLDELSSTAKLVNADGRTGCAEPLGSPYRSVEVGSDGVLAPGESASVVVQFSNPQYEPLSYRVRVLSGSANR